MGELSSPYVRRRLEKLIAAGSVPDYGKFFARRPILHQQLRSAIGEMQVHVRVTASRKPLGHSAELNKAHAGHAWHTQWGLTPATASVPPASASSLPYLDTLCPLTPGQPARDPIIDRPAALAASARAGALCVVPLVPLRSASPERHLPPRLSMHHRLDH